MVAGGDYDCTFYDCNSELAHTTYTPSGNMINVQLTFTGHSHDCDCDTGDWSCSKQDTVAGRTAMTAVARFTLVQIAPTPAATTTAPPNPTPSPTGTSYPAYWELTSSLTQLILIVAAPIHVGYADVAWWNTTLWARLSLEKDIDCNPSRCHNHAGPP